MIRTALDTSVVVSAILPDPQFHDRALSAIASASGAGRRLILPIPVLTQCFSVMTRLPPHLRVLPGDALAFLQGSFGQRADLVPADAAEGWRILADAVNAGVTGGGIYDFEILEIAARAGADRLLTFNPDDFRRFGDRGVEIVVP